MPSRALNLSEEFSLLWRRGTTGFAAITRICSNYADLQCSRLEGVVELLLSELFDSALANRLPTASHPVCRPVCYFPGRGMDEHAHGVMELG